MPAPTFYTSAAPHPLYNFNLPGSTRIPSAPDVLIVTNLYGIRLQVISPGGNMSPLHPEFDNIVRAAIDIANDGALPRSSVGKFHLYPIHCENERDVTLVSRDGKETMLFVQIICNHGHRHKAIKELLQPVDAGVLDGEKCSICMEFYDAADAKKFDDHRACKLPACGHVFGRDCVTNWLELNDTCPMCREEVEIILSFDLQIWVDCDWQMS